MSPTIQKQAQNLCSNLNDEDAVLIIGLMKRMISSEHATKTSGVKIGLGKGKITYPEDFQSWDAEVENLFEGYV